LVFDRADGNLDVDLLLGEAAFTIDGEDVVDLIAEFENVVGTDAGDIISGNGADNLIEGLQGSDIISTLTGDDTINGGAGNDLISAGGDNDLITGGLGSDSIDGGAGIDTANFSDLNVEVTVVLDENGDGTATRINEQGETEVDTLTSIENVIFSDAGGTLNGEPVMQMVEGMDAMDNMVSSAFSSLDTQEPASEADSSVFSTLSSENTALPAQVDPSTIFEADSFEADNDLAAEDAGAAADAAAAQSAIDALIAG
jgi:Ca2+-binding RTX toxin-like protein